MKGSYSIVENTINGNIYFFEDNEIFLEASLQGAIENPQILVAGKVFSDQEEQPIQDLKQLFEKVIKIDTKEIIKSLLVLQKKFHQEIKLPLKYQSQKKLH